MAVDGDVWHLVEARREDGVATTFRIRELAPRRDLPHIFVVEMPYPVTELSRLPNALAYRKLGQFEDQWVIPACHALGWEPVALKIEDGSFFLYMYGAGDPEQLMMKLAPYDAALGFYNDSDPEWSEYATLTELLAAAKAMPKAGAKPRARSKAKTKAAKTKPARKPQRSPR
ncbi:MAG TPA: hypothetical protein VMJ10_16250 [Kofleriaceae bacterium]|nr:hypothetical protein [Kofleriaceae bacterium]